MPLCLLWPPLLPPSPHCASDISLFFLFLKHAIFVPISVPSAWSYVIIEPDVLSFSNQSSFYFNVKTPLPNPDKQHPSMLLYLALTTIWHSFTLLIACVYCLFLAHQDSCFKSPELCLGHWCIRGTYEQCQEHSTNSIRKTGRQRRGKKRWKIKAYIQSGTQTFIAGFQNSERQATPHPHICKASRLGTKAFSPPLQLFLPWKVPSL